MSLRIFHLVFVVASILLSLFVSVWGFWQFASEGDRTGLALGILFAVCGVGLVLYGMKVFRKLRELE